MRHIGANYYDHFKNKDLMVLFKRLCAQNQQRKFNTLWKLLDDMTAKQIAEREARASSANTTQATQSSASGPKPFTQWIRDAMVFGNRITEYMHKKITKAQQHNVRSMGTREQRFEVACKDR